ncbi:cpr-5 [Symbiodinium sp. CCMP2592]|nr:cpr-5 [Symbiodinium sp. CCMP2592]
MAARRARWPCARPGQRRTASLPQTCLQPSPCQGTAVVIRVHGGTSQAMLRRHLTWAKRLQAAEDGAIETWILADETFLSPGVDAISRRISCMAAASGEAARFNVFPYKESDLTSMFPVLEDIRAALPDRQDVRDCFELPGPKSLAWAFHMESLLLWWRTALSGSKPKNVWVIEDDAAYSGDLLHFVKSYQTDESDLITHALRVAEPSWVWYHAGSAAFTQLLQSSRQSRLRCAEHLQRWSCRLLGALDIFAQRGIAAWSEMSVPTLARSASLIMASLHPEHVGAIFAFDGKVPEAAWPRLCQDSRTKDRWWHALKW